MLQQVRLPLAGLFHRPAIVSHMCAITSFLAVAGNILLRNLFEIQPKMSTPYTLDATDTDWL